MLCFSSSIVLGLEIKKLVLRYARQKQSQEERSGEGAGHGISVLQEMTCCGNISHVLHFQSSGYENKQNYRYWAPKNPEELHRRLLRNDKLTV
jgi:hypothetical protein